MRDEDWTDRVMQLVAAVMAGGVAVGIIGLLAYGLSMWIKCGLPACSP